MEPRQLVGPVGSDQEERPTGDLGRDVPEDLQAGRVGPVEVFEKDDRGADGGQLGEESADLGEEGGLVGDGLQLAAGEGRRGGGKDASVRQPA